MFGTGPDVRSFTFRFNTDMRHHLNPDDPNFEQQVRYYQARRRNRALGTGVALLCVGGFMLLHRLRVVPSIHLTWPFILIIIGLFVGLRSRFQNNGWWVLILIGTAHAIPPFHIYGDLDSTDLALPLGLIIGGCFLLFRGQKKKEYSTSVLTVENMANPESLLDINTLFGGRKEVVTSKNFAGGSVSTVFGGTELNLMQAEGMPNQVLELQIQVTFGGVELIVPSHWTVQNNISPVFGGIDDRRHIQTNDSSPNKTVLVLNGSCVFGGIEIKSY
jgi:hypothetical protein